MSLLQGMLERCVRLVPDESTDGLGGYAREWTEGEAFDAALIKAGSGEDAEGQKTVLDERFTVVVAGGTVLEYHDAFKRLSDGQVFRVTGTTRDAAAPAASTVKIARAACERWVPV